MMPVFEHVSVPLCGYDEYRTHTYGYDLPLILAMLSSGLDFPSVPLEHKKRCAFEHHCGQDRADLVETGPITLGRDILVQGWGGLGRRTLRL